ncbi:hypothetical protein BGZ60DRAFT_523157 [Tricladium varicosporioides]|nr:hypothetical protein BGZ60DRAFT_523157 [Hymenoscyphus varicosporioides]
MTKTRNPHRTLSSWKRDITLLTCILQMRIQPAIPFSIVSECLLSTWPTSMLKIGERRMSKEGRAEYIASGKLFNWLTKFLQHKFEQAESSCGELWTLAKDCSEGVVKEVLAATEFQDMGYELLTADEMLLQIQWRKARDWRAGSTPLGRPERIEKNCDFSREIGNRPANCCGRRASTSQPQTATIQSLHSISRKAPKLTEDHRQNFSPSASIIQPMQIFSCEVQKAVDGLTNFDNRPKAYKSIISTNVGGWKRTLRILRELQRENSIQRDTSSPKIPSQLPGNPFAEQNEKIQLIKKVSGLEPSESPGKVFQSLYSDCSYSNYIYSAYTIPGNFERVEMRI